MYRRRIRTRGYNGNVDTRHPFTERAVIDLAPERVQIGEVFDAVEIGSSNGMVWGHWGVPAALGHDCCGVGAYGQSTVGDRGVVEAC